MSEKVQPYLKMNMGTCLEDSTYDLSFNHGDISFIILEMTHLEIRKMILDIEDMLELLSTTEIGYKKMEVNYEE